jgi:hypothetical protein
MLDCLNRLSQRSTDTRDATFERWALIGVLAVWGAMAGTMFTWIALYARNVPTREDWTMVPALVGKEANLFQWLWAQTMEHRTPLQRAVYLVLLRASDGDFRSGIIANALMLSGLCLAMILVARRLRGSQTRLADAFFPLTLLLLSEHISLGYNIQFVISVGLSCIWLLIIVADSWPWSPKIAVTAGFTLVLLPLSGGNGMIFTPFVALWLAAGTLLYRRERTARWIVPFQSGCVIVSITLAGLYFVGYERATPPNPSVVATMITAARFVGMALGQVGSGTGRVFPGSIVGVLFCGIGCLLWASGLIPLRRALRSTSSAECFRVFGFLMFAAAMAALILLIAWGRAGLVPTQGMPDRYALLSVPGLCAVYFAWILYGPDITRNRVESAFAIAALLALPFNLEKSLEASKPYSAGMRAFEQDLADGFSWTELAERHQKFLMDWDYSSVMNGMQMLHEAKMGPWKTALR